MEKKDIFHLVFVFIGKVRLYAYSKTNTDCLVYINFLMLVNLKSTSVVVSFDISMGSKRLAIACSNEAIRSFNISEVR